MFELQNNSKSAPATTIPAPPVLTDELSRGNKLGARAKASPLRLEPGAAPASPGSNFNEPMGGAKQVAPDRSLYAQMPMSKTVVAESQARQRSDQTDLRAKVEESAAAQGLSKEAGVVTQEKSPALKPSPSASGKDQSGVLVVDKAATPAAEAAAPAAPAEQKAVGGLARPSKKKDEDATGTGATKRETDEGNQSLSGLSRVQALEGRYDAIVANGSAGLRWNVTPDGNVLRSIDAGKNWKAMTIDAKAEFVSVAATGPSIWAGGKHGVLYHSMDVGEHWTRVTPTDRGVILTSDITSIQFDNADQGSVRAGQGEIWLTADGGKSWKRNF
jgi:hypothetical protein